MEFTVADLFMYSQRYLTKLLVGMSAVIDIIQTPLETFIKANMSLTVPGGILGVIGLDKIGFFDHPLFEFFRNYTLLDLMLEAGLGIFIAYTFIKWAVGIVTGS